jgi:hypothetical protein
MSPASYQIAPFRDIKILKVAEEKGFEPLRRFLDLPVFKTGPFNQTWVFLHSFLVPQTRVELVRAFTLAGF